MSVLIAVLVTLVPGPADSLSHEGIVPAPADKVWAAFTTREGLESWCVAHASVDLRLGGKMLTHYRKEGTIGDEGTIENTYLAYDPARMLSFKITKAPKGFPFTAPAEKVWTVVYFEPVGSDRTKVTIRMLGYDRTEASQQMRRFFDAGNKATLDALIAHFKKA